MKKLNIALIVYIIILILGIVWVYNYKIESYGSSDTKISKTSNKTKEKKKEEQPKEEKKKNLKMI